MTNNKRESGYNITVTKVLAYVAKIYVLRGRVQGVGFRYYVERAANSLRLTGYVRNLDDGTVEVYAIGSPEQLSDLAGLLWKGPPTADVRGVDVRDAAIEKCHGFSTR